jgi:hypothetical protein
LTRFFYEGNRYTPGRGGSFAYFCFEEVSYMNFRVQVSLKSKGVFRGTGIIEKVDIFNYSVRGYDVDAIEEGVGYPVYFGLGGIEFS